MLVILQLAYLIVLIDWKPYSEDSVQNKELLHEVNSLIVLYFLTLFTGMVIPDSRLKEQIGLALISLEVLNLLVNIVPLLYYALKSIIRRCKVHYQINQAKRDVFKAL